MEPPAVVIDTGSSSTKVGFAGDARPRSIFPTVIGRPRYQEVLLDSRSHHCAYVGAESQVRRGVLLLEQPMSNRKVEDWDAMQQIWDHALHCELGVTEKGGAALLTVGPQSERSMRERMMDYFFECFGMDKVSFAKQPLLALFATGEITGLVVDSGQDITYAVPINNGKVLASQVLQSDLAGHHVTTSLARLLSQTAGTVFSSSAEMEIVREIKERLVYVALDYDAEMAEVDSGHLGPSLYKMPDGTQIVIPAERFSCAEELFRPELLLHSTQLGLVDLVHQSATLCLPTLQASMFGSIVMAGGNTLLPNMGRRLEHDLSTKTECRVKVDSPPERKYSAWLGGSLLASLNSYRSQWITRKEFEEHGKAILDKKDD